MDSGGDSWAAAAARDGQLLLNRASPDRTVIELGLLKGV